MIPITRRATKRNTVRYVGCERPHRRHSTLIATRIETHTTSADRSRTLAWFIARRPGGATIDQQAYNAIHGALRCLGERANSLLKTTYKNLRRYRGCPWRLGDIVAAAMVLLHHEHHRTT